MASSVGVEIAGVSASSARAADEVKPISPHPMSSTKMRIMLGRGAVSCACTVTPQSANIAPIHKDSFIRCVYYHTRTPFSRKKTEGVRQEECSLQGVFEKAKLD